MALSKNLERVEFSGDYEEKKLQFSVAANTTFYYGGLVAGSRAAGADQGKVIKHTNSADIVSLGICLERDWETGGLDEGEAVGRFAYKPKVWLVKSDASDSDLFKKYYASDDNTITTTANQAPTIGTCIDWKAGFILIDMSRV